MIRLSIGILIGWLAYETFQKDGDKMSDVVKSCIAKTVEAIKTAQLTEKKENCEGEELCSTTKKKKK